MSNDSASKKVVSFVPNMISAKAGLDTRYSQVSGLSLAAQTAGSAQIGSCTLTVVKPVVVAKPGLVKAVS